MCSSQGSHPGGGVTADRPWPVLGFNDVEWAQWVGVLPGPVTGSPFWHRQPPRWRTHWCERVEMPLCLQRH